MEFTTEVQDGVYVVSVQGEIDGSTAPELQDAVMPLLVQDSRVVLELSSVSFMSSAGLRAMLMFYRHTTEANSKLVLVGVSHEIQEAMKATGFLKYFTRAPGLAEGLQLLGA